MKKAIIAFIFSHGWSPSPITESALAEIAQALAVASLRYGWLYGDPNMRTAVLGSGLTATAARWPSLN